MRKTVPPFLLLLLLGVFTSANASTMQVFSQDAYTIYAFGNGANLGVIFQGIQGLIASSLFQHLVLAVMLLGFALVVLQSLSNHAGGLTNMIIYISVAGLLGIGAIKETTNVKIDDPLNPSTNQVISGIPSLIVYPAYFFNEMGHALSMAFDEAYSAISHVPLSLTLTGGVTESVVGAPFNISAQMLYDAAHYQLVDPYLKNSLTHYVVDCAVPAIANGRLSTDTLLTSPDLWGVLKATSGNPALTTVYYGTLSKATTGMGVVKTCSAAQASISHDLKDAQKTMGADFSRHFGESVSATVASQLFDQVIQYNAGNKENTPTPGQLLQQASLLKLFHGPIQTMMANQTNSTALMNAVGIAKGEKETTSGWMMSAKIFSATFGYIFSILEVLIYAFIPIVILFVVMPGINRLMIVRYTRLLAWFPVTFVVFGIANDILTQLTFHALNPLWTDYQGLSQVTESMISAKAAKFISVGAWLTTIIPLVTWGILSRSDFALTDVIKSTGARSSDDAGRTAADGNVTLDSRRYDDISAHQHHSAFQTQLGADPVESHVMGASPNQSLDVGGTRLQRNMAPLMKMVQTVQQHATESASLHQQELSHQDSLSTTDSLQKSAVASSKSIDAINGSIQTSYKGGWVAAASMAGLQGYLAHHNFHLSEHDQTHLAQMSAQTAALSSQAAQADAQGDHQQSQSLLAKAESSVKSGHDWLTKKMGGSRAASASAWGLMGAATAVATTAALAGAVIALPEEGLAAAGAGLAVAGRGMLSGARALGGYLSRVFGGAAGAESKVALREVRTAAQWTSENESAYAAYEAQGGATLSKEEMALQSQGERAAIQTAERGTGAKTGGKRAWLGRLKQLSGALGKGLSGELSETSSGKFQIEAQKSRMALHEEKAVDSDQQTNRDGVSDKSTTSQVRTETSVESFPNYGALSETQQPENATENNKSAPQNPAKHLGSVSADLKARIDGFKRHAADVRENTEKGSTYRGPLGELTVSDSTKAVLNDE
jgi:hypothetical protein